MRRFGPGLLDAGASSAATFLAGIYAARFLELGELGAYALVFAGVMLFTQLPTQVVLIPAEARLVRVDRSVRIDHLASSLRACAPWTLLAAALTLVIGFIVPEAVTSRWLLAVTGAAVTVFSPMQDHARRMLHLSGLHGTAAAVSMVRVAVLVLALTLGSVWGIEAALIPLGALAVADLLSMGLAFGRARGRGQSLPFRVADLASSGSWLLGSSVAAPAAGFVVSFVVTRLAGQEVLGLAEAARVTAQPMLVLAMGISAVLGPEAMEAARDQDRPRARRATARLAVSTLVAAVVYLAVTLLPLDVNPVAWAVPRAFEISGLAQLSIVAAVFNALVFLHRSELVVLDRARPMAWVETLAGSLRALVSAGAGAIGAWVVPLGFLVGGIVRVGLFTWLVERPDGHSSRGGDDEELVDPARFE